MNTSGGITNLHSNLGHIHKKKKYSKVLKQPSIIH